MANALYAKGKQHILDNALDLKDGDIRATLVSSAYTPNLATHEFRNAIPSPAFSVSSNVALANKTVTNGVFDADDVTFPGATVISQNVTYVLIYLHTGNDATEKLVALIDLAAGLPFTAVNGTDVTVRWSNGDSKIFAI